MTVLVVEDDRLILDGLAFALCREGYQVLTASTMREALELIQKGDRADFYLLDIRLPDGDGFEICRRIREREDTPVLFLTACDDEVHTVMALEQGADDYIVKPFRIRELTARMRAILRRTSGGKSREQVAAVGPNIVNLQTGRVYADGQEVILTAMEYRLLLIFLNNRGQILSRGQILGELWDEAGEYVNDNTLSVYIKRLRRKLGDTAEGQMITTVRGIGYRMEK